FVSAPLFGQSYNRYAYVLNNPTTLVDPSGFEEECGSPICIGGSGGGGGGGGGPCGPFGGGPGGGRWDPRPPPHRWPRLELPTSLGTTETTTCLGEKVRNRSAASRHPYRHERFVPDRG